MSTEALTLELEPLRQRLDEAKQRLAAVRGYL